MPTLYKRNASASCKINKLNIDKHSGKPKVKCF